MGEQGADQDLACLNKESGINPEGSGSLEGF